MAATPTAAVSDVADVSTITQLILTERESRDLGRWERLGACYLPDSHVEISWISGTEAQFVAGERALASLAGVIDIPGEIEGVGFCLSSHARLLYPVERRDGRWGLMGFYGIYVRDEIVTRIPGQQLPILAQDLTMFRPSYRMLSWLLTRQGGYVLNNDLPGVDRPEAAEALEQKLLAWAGVQAQGPVPSGRCMADLASESLRAMAHISGARRQVQWAHAAKDYHHHGRGGRTPDSCRT